MQKQRLILLLLLVPVVLTWCFLIVKVPCLDARSSYGFQVLDDQRMMVTLMNQRWVRGDEQWWAQYAVFDPATRRLNILKENPGLSKRDRTYLNRDSEREGFWVVQNPGEDIQQTSFTFPVVPNLIGQRFAVGFDKSATYVLDLESKSNRIVRSANDNDTWSNWAIPMEDAHQFYRLNQLVTPAQIKAGQQLLLDVFEIQSDSDPKLVASWPVLPTKSTHRSVAVLPDYFVSVDPDGQRLEYRNHGSSEIVEIHEVPKSIDLTLATWNFNEERFEIRTTDSCLIFDCRRRTWLKVPNGPYYVASEDKDQSKLLMVHFDQGTKHVVMDMNRGEPRCTFELEWPALGLSFVDSDTIATYDRRDGITLQTVDANTGELQKTYRPYWWAAPLLLIAGLTYVVWSVVWVRTGHRSIIHVTLDVLILVGLPILALTFRLYWAGDSGDIGRYPMFALEGAAAALAVHSAVWWSLGRGRIVLRGLPAFATTLTVLGIGRVIASDDSIMWESMAFVGLLILVLVIGCEISRRLFRLTLTDTATVDGGNKANKLHLKDMFVATTGIAALVALWPKTLPTSVILWWGPFEILLSGFLGALAGMLLVMWPTKRWNPSAIVAIVGSSIALLVIPASHFSAGEPADWWWRCGQQVIVFLAALLTSSLIAFRFRTSDWRFSRNRGTA